MNFLPDPILAARLHACQLQACSIYDNATATQCSQRHSCCVDVTHWHTSVDTATGRYTLVLVRLATDTSPSIREYEDWIAFFHCRRWVQSVIVAPGMKPIKLGRSAARLGRPSVYLMLLVTNNHCRRECDARWIYSDGCLGCMAPIVLEGIKKSWKDAKWRPLQHTCMCCVARSLQ